MAKPKFRLILQLSVVDEDGVIITGDVAIGKLKPFVDEGADVHAYVKQFACTQFEYCIDTLHDQESADLVMKRI